MSINYKKILTKGYQSALSNTPVEDGKIRVATDTGQLFIDDNGTRTEVTDFVKGHTEEEILATIAPLPKIYLSSDTHKLFVFDGEDWLICGEPNSGAVEIDHASTADKATQDSSGQTINKTYIKNINIVGQTVTITKGDNTTFTLTTQDTTYSNMEGATSSKNGTSGLVPAPVAGEQDKFFRGDGKWTIPSDRKYCLVGSNEPDTAGWYKVASQTMSGFGDTNATFVVTGTFGKYFSGILQLQMRSNNTPPLACMVLKWHTRIGFDPGDVICVIDGMTYTLYVNLKYPQFSRIMFEVISESSVNTADSRIELYNSSEPEVEAPIATVVAADGATVNLSNSTNQVNQIALSNENLDDIISENVTWYYAPGLNTVINNPFGEGVAFGLCVYRNATGYRMQEATSLYGIKKVRYHNNSVWSDWRTLAYNDDCLDTNTGGTVNGNISAKNILPLEAAKYNIGEETKPYSNIYSEKFAVRANTSGVTYGGLVLSTLGTTEVEGVGRLITGNNLPLGTDNNSSGAIRIYGNKTGSTNLYPGNNTDSNVYQYLPAKSGTLALNEDLTSHIEDKSNPHEVTKSQIGLGNVENKSSATIRGELTKSNIITALGYTPIDASKKGVANGLAELDENGIVPSSQLPSYVDDVLEYSSQNAFPATGESGKIYIAQDTNLTYRWSGSGYAEISKSLALGETINTAYRGDRGAIAYTHSQKTSGNPHGVTKNDVGLGNVDNTSDMNKPVSTAQQAALDAKVDKVNGKGLSTNDYTTEEKNKLAGITAGANAYTHPTTSGNKHIPSGGSKDQILRWSANGTAVWDNEKDTTYNDATTSKSGLMSASDKSTFDDIPNKYLSLLGGKLTLEGLANLRFYRSGTNVYVGHTYEHDGGVLGSIGMNTVDGGLKRISADYKSFHTVLDTGNYTNHVVPKSGGVYDGTINTQTILPSQGSSHDIGGTTLPYLNGYFKTLALRMNTSGAGYGGLTATTAGTETTEGVARLILGNDRKAGTVDNASGALRLFGTGAGQTNLYPSNNSDSNIYQYLPAKSGTLALEGAPLFSSRGINGTAGYIAFAQLKVTGNYVNRPIEFSLSCRGKSTTCHVNVLFKNSGTSDPDIDSITCTGSNYGIFAHKVDTSTWLLYHTKTEAYDSITVLSIGQPDQSVTVTYPDAETTFITEKPVENVIDSRFGGYLQLLGGGTVEGDTLELLRIKRTSANSAVVGFENLNGPLGYIGMTGTPNGGLRRILADASAGYTILDENNMGNYVVPKTGGEYTGPVTGTNIIAKWFQVTANNASNTAKSKICVQDDAGWIYTRTNEQILSDIGAVSKAGDTITGALNVARINPISALTNNLGQSTNPFLSLFTDTVALRGDTSGTSYGALCVNTPGTTSETGISKLTLGNAKAAGTDANAKGTIEIYSSNTARTTVNANDNATSNITITLPEKSGTLVTEDDFDFGELE